MPQGPTRRRRVVAGGTTKKTVVVSGPGSASTEAGAAQCETDDAPLALTCSRDGKWLIVTSPHEVRILHLDTLRLERVIELDAQASAPSVAEGGKGELWIGGRHLYRCDMFAGKPAKAGTKLAGLVDSICLLRPDLLAGVGSRGELLWSTEDTKVVHQRLQARKHVAHVVATPDERAAFCDGETHAWIIDPAYTSGYTKLSLRAPSSEVRGPDDSAPVDLIALSLDGRCILGARDGTVGWTRANGRFDRQCHPASGQRPALALAGDDHWIYVLRDNGLLQRFVTRDLASEQDADQSHKSGVQNTHARHGQRARTARGQLPHPAQECRLGKMASCMALHIEPNIEADGGDKDDSLRRRFNAHARSQTLIFGGPRAQGSLGSIWKISPAELDWQPIELGRRSPWQPPPPPPELPAFVATRSKLTGPKLRDLAVDSVLAAKSPYFVTHGQGDPLDWNCNPGPSDPLMAGDGLAFAAMLRFNQGTARPALLVCPSRVHVDEDPAPPLQWLVWGDDPRAWIQLTTPEIRRQRWSRTEVFPIMAAAIAHPAPAGLPGHRSKIPSRYADRQLFDSMVQECKKLMEVLW